MLARPNWLYIANPLRILIVVIALLVCMLQGQTASAPKREHFTNADVLTDWVTNNKGHKLRTFITRPKNPSGKVPVIFFVGWLSCDSMEYPDGETDGFGTLMLRLIEQSGYASVRMNKPGVGESQGKCEAADFNDEMEGWQAAFDSMAKYDFMDRDRVFVVGLSNGGGFSPLVARNHAVRGYVSAGSWGRTWYEHMLELERIRLTGSKQPPADVNLAVRIFGDFYRLYLIEGMKPGEILARHPEWKDLWYDAPDGQYGRPAAFYQQLQSLNLGDAWQKTQAPVLVIRGTADSIMSHNDAATIAQIVNQVRPGQARYWEIEGMTHGFTVDGRFCDQIVPEILGWMKLQIK
jgi:pimeloyl-ACP methyl ester carboxylesterase